MRISDALKERRDLDITFGGGVVLHVTYQPSAVTIADVEALKADRDIRRVAEQIRQQVLQWDLTDDYDRLIPLERPQPRTVMGDGAIVNERGEIVEPGAPTVTESQTDPLHTVPIHILTKILIAIQTDQRPDPEA